MPTSGEFLKHLEASELLSAEEVASVRVEAANDGVDGEALAVRLVKQGKLTAYQAKQLLAGRSRGFVVGGYTIVEAIGQGGMGMVFKAEHRELKRPAAIKVLPPQAATNPDSVRRFLREARATALLEHENIVRAYGGGPVGDAYFIAM